jgi:hypothetical protein
VGEMVDVTEADEVEEVDRDVKDGRGAMRS